MSDWLDPATWQTVMDAAGECKPVEFRGFPPVVINAEMMSDVKPYPLDLIDAWHAGTWPPQPVEPTGDGFLVPPGFGEELRDALEAMVLSRLATGGGVFVTREHKPVPRRTRLRWWRARQRENLASLAYRLIAGQDVPGGDE